MLSFFNTLVFCFLLGTILIVLFLLAELGREWHRGENGLTGPLFLLATGLFFSTTMGLFIALTSVKESPAGLFIPPAWIVNNYNEVVVPWNAIGRGFIFAGLWWAILAIRFKRGNKC